MKNVFPLKIVFLFVTTLVTISFIGCGEDITIDEDIAIFDMSIEHVDISVSETDKMVGSEPLFSVTVWVYGVAGPTTCYGHHETDYLQRDDYAGQPLYRNGDIIDISISAFGPTGPAFCGDAVTFHDEAIFVGFCVPGEYTLHVNDFTQTFRVGSDL